MCRIAKATFSFLVLLAAQSAYSQNNEHCSQLFEFANSIQPNSQQSVKFASVWNKMEKSCNHGGFRPAEKLCSWMLTNYSGEYMEDNLRMITSCLGAPGYLDARNSLFQNASGSLIFFEAEGMKKSVSMTLKYSIRQSVESSITITVESD